MYQGKRTQPANSMSSETTLEKGQMVKILWAESADITNGDKNTKLWVSFTFVRQNSKLKGLSMVSPRLTLAWL